LRVLFAEKLSGAFEVRHRSRRFRRYGASQADRYLYADGK
jgi:hypothetical protein